MKHPNRILYIFILIALLAVSLGVTTHSAVAVGPYVCLPTCSTTDGRMLALASVGYATLAGNTISVEISVPASTPSFEIGIFDGDSNGAWDYGPTHTPLVYTLYADPTNNGATSIQLAQWSGTSMADNAWTDFTVNQDPQALAPSGDYFYHIHIDIPSPVTVDTWSNFKIRSNTPVELSANESFAYAVPLYTTADATILYPNGIPTSLPNNNVPTTFDGTWDMYFYVPTASPNFVIWDGDMDHGSYDCSVNDTDDSDTPDGILPPWVAGISEVPEGVAVSSLTCVNAAGQAITGPNGQIYTTGNPTDDSRFPAFQRSSAVNYDVIDPNGNVYHNDNPSGNQEWEQFRIDTDPNTPADHHVTGLLPAGIYHIHVSGLDLRNLNAWHTIYNYVCVHEDGSPCIPVLHPYLIGDTVWKDANGNGVQDNGETGISGVTVTLLDVNGLPVPGGTAVTDANGQYTFSVDAGTYSVQVNSSNFSVGGVLAGLSSTTGGELQTNTVTTANILTYDFGYRGTASLGDKVWNDLNGNGIQDGSEAGIAGVSVFLLGGDGVTVVGTMTTDSFGYYNFTNLPFGTYTVQFVAPSGLTFTTKNAAGSTAANDSNAIPSTGKTDAITLVAGQADNTIDAGLYQSASLGDFVWNDLNGNGFQNDGEPGYEGVTVKLLGSDGTTVLSTTTTDAAGNYSFTNLPAGTYTVQFVALTGTTLTTANAGADDARDSDANVTTGKTGAVTLVAGQTNNTVDAGLKDSMSLSCPANLVLNPSFELNSGSPPTNWTNGTAGNIGIPAPDGSKVGYISGTGTMYQKVNVVVGNSYTVTFYSGSHVPSIQTVKIQYYTSTGSAIGTASKHTITSDLQDSGFGGPYTLSLGAAPSNAKYLKIMVSANNKDYAKVDKFCLQTGTPPATASIGDFVWSDGDGGGTQNGSPSVGIPNVTVKLLNSGGTVISTTVTNSSGYYSFSNLVSGQYTVQFIAPAGYAFTPANVGSDDTKDSDANVTTGKTGVITLGVGEVNNTVDAGLKQTTGWVCQNNLVLNPSFELNTGSPPTNWTNGTAGNIGIPSPHGNNVAYISGLGIMYQKVNVVSGKSYTFSFYSGSHVPSIQTVKIQYYTSTGSAIGTASTHTIISDLEITGFGGPYTLTLGAAPSNAAYLKIMVSANNKDYAKVDALCLQATP